MPPRQTTQTLSTIFPELPAVPNPEPVPTTKPHGYKPERLKAKPSKSFYEVMQDGETTVVRGYDLLPTLSQRGLSFEQARAATTQAIKHLVGGGGSFEVGGLTIKRYEEE